MAIERKAFSVREVAALLGVTSKCVYDMVRGGTLYAVRIGKGLREIRIPKVAIDRFLEGGCTDESSTDRGARVTN